MEIKKSLLNLCLAEKDRYPLAQIQDYYKVVFQSIFGAGHLITNSDSSIQYLKEEWDSISQNSTDDLLTNISLTTPMYRLNLIRAKAENISQDEIIDAFLKGCNQVRNPLQNCFSGALTHLSELLRVDPFCFSEDEINKTLPLEAKNDFPILHHSKVYRDLYHPHYRVIPGDNLRREWCDIFPC